MGILKSELPKEDTVIIEIYKFNDPYKGWGKDKTLKFAKVNVSDLVEHPHFNDMMVLTFDRLLDHGVDHEHGYDIITREKAQAKVDELNKVLKETEELKLNLLRVL